MDVYTNMQRAVNQLSMAISGLANEMNLFNADLMDARRRLDALLKTPFYRRQMVESELGYTVPDWVWAVWEQQRRTFGSGNGREMMD